MLFPSWSIHALSSCHPEQSEGSGCFSSWDPILSKAKDLAAFPVVILSKAKDLATFPGCHPEQCEDLATFPGCHPEQCEGSGYLSWLSS